MTQISCLGQLTLMNMCFWFTWSNIWVFTQVCFYIDTCGCSLSSGNDAELQVLLTFWMATLFM